MDEDDRIADLADVPADGTLVATVREGFDESEVVLTRLGGESADEDAITAWQNYSSACKSPHDRSHAVERTDL
jgi:hypothetical protein